MTIVDLAEGLALYYHGGQLYGTEPYDVHLREVIGVIKQYVELPSPELLSSGWLHDVLEDCDEANFEEIYAKISPRVAQLVYLVTDGFGPTRKMKKLQMYAKLASDPEGIILKLADRIANCRRAGKLSMYREEYPVFKQALFTHGHATKMWQELDKLLAP